MKKIKIILLFSLSLNVLFLCAGSFMVYKKGGVDYLTGKFMGSSSVQILPAAYQQRVSIFDQSQTTNVDVAFIGDSLTDQGAWDEYFPELKVINRGIGGDTTHGVLNRLDEIVKRNPKKVFIMVGVNDNLNEMEKVISNYKKIIETLMNKIPNSEIYIQSTLPINNEIYGDSINNDKIKAFDRQLKKETKKYKVNYIDLSSVLSENNQLLSRYTVDGVHLTGEGYRIWVNTIEKYVTE